MGSNMSRTYIKKKQPPTYSLEDIERAVNDIQNGNTTYRQAKERYGIPISVIFHRITGRKGLSAPNWDLYKKHDSEGPSKAKFIFNCDESGFASDPSRLKALGEKGKPLSRVSGGSGRESTTVLICVSADGFFLPPLIVFKGAAVQARWTSTQSYPGTRYAASSKGWMEEPQFFFWFKDCFIEHVKHIRSHDNVDQAAVLLYDGHASHYSLRIVEEAIKNKIELMRFPSHLTDRIQPLDKCVFAPVKVKWDKKLVQYGKSEVGQGTGRLTSNIEDSMSPEIQNIAIDLSTRMNEPSPMKPLDNPRTIVEIFSSVLEKKSQSQTVELKKNATVVRRLTQSSYGEVLTSEEVR
uniref:Uncharacterized protein LOC114346440 n=1 Tax=Diabrotica virgifera virgifera TaxID=50390 RepID=A0A6P7H5K0_DIAVI